ncbi:MAG: hypothetical protein IPP72_01695 [Chitinophagaceae bacterium]|nr:hypothetical protein [Chitinophagaceae bacterium]
MNTTELLQVIVKKIRRYKTIILAAGMLLAILAFFYARGKRTTYTAKATVFPLTSPSDNAISNSMLNGILGLSDAPKSFSNEATINIIELAFSRRMRESVAMTRLPQFNNKMIGELVMNDINDHKTLFAKNIVIPNDSIVLSVEAGEILKPGINAKMSKNGVLELYFTGTKQELITPISNVMIEKLSKFYIELKRQKALDDYNFTLDKIDSLQRMINRVDREAIGMQQRTLFTPPDLLEYAIPKENVSSEKTRILRQRDMYINNRDEAVWRLQKVTPIIAVLDKPNAPFDETSQPVLLLMILGFLAGSFIGTIVLISGLLYRFGKAEIHKSIFGS